MLRIAVVLEEAEEGGFTVQVPTLPGCFSEGETLDEALANIREAIEVHLEAVPDDLLSVPLDPTGYKLVELVWNDPPADLPSDPVGRSFAVVRRSRPSPTS